MGETLHDRLVQLSDVLHWLGKHEEAQVVSLIARFVQQQNLTNVSDLERFVDVSANEK